MKTFCISLPETPWRRAAAETHFKERGLEDVIFVNGIHAETFGLLTRHPYEVDHPGTGYRIPSKHVGLCLSHYMVWEICRLSPSVLGKFLIIEDDAQFEAGWLGKLSDEMFAYLPVDTDILLIGSGNTTDKPKTQVGGNIWDVRFPQCTHAYIVWEKALPVLLETQRRIWAPIDLALIFNSYPKLKVMTYLPRLVSQRGQEIAP